MVPTDVVYTCGYYDRTRIANSGCYFLYHLLVISFIQQEGIREIVIDPSNNKSILEIPKNKDNNIHESESLKWKNKRTLTLRVSELNKKDINA